MCERELSQVHVHRPASNLRSLAELALLLFILTWAFLMPAIVVAGYRWLL